MKVTGFRVPDGNTWWYQIASSPWNNAYYASADAFYNNGATSGSLIGTPFVDPSIPDCAGQQPVSASAPSTQSVGGANSTAPSSGPPTYSETPGGVSHTWTDYAKRWRFRRTFDSVERDGSDHVQGHRVRCG